MKPPANHLSMMQIDCEVINTSLVHISEDAIPAHLNANIRMKSEHSTSTHATSNSSLQRNDSQKSHMDNFGGNVTGANPKAFEDFDKSNNSTRYLKLLNFLCWLKNMVKRYMLPVSYST